jgi:hypothetical protein
MHKIAPPNELKLENIQVSQTMAMVLFLVASEIWMMEIS